MELVDGMFLLAICSFKLAYYECFNQAIRNYTDTLSQLQTAKEKQVCWLLPIFSTSRTRCMRDWRKQMLNLSTILRVFMRPTETLWSIHTLWKCWIKCTNSISLLLTYVREEVRHFPEKYATLVQSNQTLAAAKLLVATYNQVTSAELNHIGALSAINMRIIREVSNAEEIADMKARTKFSSSLSIII